MLLNSAKNGTGYISDLVVPAQWGAGIIWTSFSLLNVQNFTKIEKRKILKNYDNLKMLCSSVILPQVQISNAKTFAVFEIF